MSIETIGSPDIGLHEKSSGTGAAGVEKRCLSALLERAFSANYDPELDFEVVVHIDNSTTIGNDEAGRWMLGCLEKECSARCIMVMTGSGEEATLSIPDTRMLNACTEDR